MTARIWRFRDDKRRFYRVKDWDDGPWWDEPDKMQWVDEETDLDCLIVRNRLGALCGYVGVPEGHPYFGLHYRDVPVHVHGGLTFARTCADGDDVQDVCHVPEPGRPEHVWWLGFDCSHFGDCIPAMPEIYRSTILKVEYRDIAYVQNECRELARQCADAARDYQDQP